MACRLEYLAVVSGDMCEIGELALLTTFHVQGIFSLLPSTAQHLLPVSKNSVRRAQRLIQEAQGRQQLLRITQIVFRVGIT